MKLQSVLYARLAFVVSGVALTDTTHDASGPYDIEPHSNDIPTIQKNRGGWVNPEDLDPMPQCIAQQDQSAWLGAMTRCTRHRCTNHFIFCTHYQWLTQLNCLSAEFSPSTVNSYVEYCSRSVLAKAQLAQWIQHVTGRGWLVQAGDTNSLQNLSPRSLTQGYKAVSVAQKAPVCLRKATSQSRETFDHVMGSCGFTSTTLHIGNAARPWEYSTALKSMTALSFGTAGYDLTKSHVPAGEYFEKECFCNHFPIAQQQEPCWDHLDLTKERLWLHAICGPTNLPDNWKKSLKILGKDFIPLWRWALTSDILDMPPSVPELTQQCKTEACNTDSEGFCLVEPAIDRTCICGKVDYSLCQGACQSFESRKQYIEWLLTTCDDVKDWHGLPKHWHELLAPRPREMIPWRWNLRSENANHTVCPSYLTKIGSFAFVNLVTILAVYFGEKYSKGTNTLKPHPKNPAWILRGLVLASVQLGGNWVNVKIVQSTPGYENVPMSQLMLLWCSLPRLGWLAIAPAGIHRPESKDLAAASSALYAEAFLQMLNLYYMTTVVKYGLQHGFYFGVLPDTELGCSAWLMYGGALLWLFAFGMTAILVIRILRPLFPSRIPTNRTAEDLSECDVNGCTGPYHNSGVRESLLPESHRSSSSKGSSYGTIPPVAGPSPPHEDPREPHLSLYVMLTLGLPALCLAQWLFWIGFIRVSGEDFCPPLLEAMTGVWAASSLATVLLKFII